MSDGIDNYTPEDYLKQIIGDTQNQFRILTTWSEKQQQEFKDIVDDLKKPGANGR